ncbi:MAG: aldolase catalytic domain-containing protein [Aquisalimonadaceae bacterium]
MKKNGHKVTILDCTFRDGGYYNDWDFSNSLAEKYLQVMHETGVDFVEIGFRFGKMEGFLGPYAYSTDRWLRSLPVPPGMQIGVMCNAKDLIQDGRPVEVVHQLFSPAAESPVELVRIAAHFNEVEACAPVVRTLHELGYRVGFNLMQAGGRSARDITTMARRVADWPMEALYFADSLGNMCPGDVTATVGALRAGWPGAIGFHSHDNMGNALANTLAAHDAGATWLDATVLGMGRGAGNVRLEYLLLELARQGVRDSQVDALLEFVVGDFSALQSKYNWGANLFYHLSALYGVHPTYVQEMLSEDRYSHDQVISALQRLGDLDASGYSRARLLAAMQSETIDSVGTWVPGDWLKGRDVLLIGPGERGHRHLQGLLQYIGEEKPVVLCLNSNAWFPSDKVDAWVACNPQRLSLDRDYYQQRRGRLAVPAGLIPCSVRPALQNWELLDFGLHINGGGFDVRESCAVLPRPLSALYAIALAEAAGARRVLLAGLDGYAHDDPRHAEIDQGVQSYLSRDSALAVVALTPTSLSVRQMSLYAPEV